MIKVDFYIIFWREMTVLKRKVGKFLLPRLVSPLLYLVAFGWGLGSAIQINGTSYMYYVVPGIIALSAMNISFSSVGTAINMSRLYHKTFEEFRIAPISAISYVLGHILAGSVRGFLVAAIILALAFFFGAPIAVSPSLILILLLTCLLFSSFGVIAAMSIDSHEDMANFSTLVLLPMSFLCSTFFSTRNYPEYIRYFIEILPLTQASNALRKITLGQGLPAVSLLVLSVYFIFLFLWAIRAVNRIK